MQKYKECRSFKSTLYLIVVNYLNSHFVGSHRRNIIKSPILALFIYSNRYFVSFNAASVKPWWHYFFHIWYRGESEEKLANLLNILNQIHSVEKKNESGSIFVTSKRIALESFGEYNVTLLNICESITKKRGQLLQRNQSLLNMLSTSEKMKKRREPHRANYFPLFFPSYFQYEFKIQSPEKAVAVDQDWSWTADPAHQQTVPISYPLLLNQSRSR